MAHHCWELQFQEIWDFFWIPWNGIHSQRHKHKLMFLINFFKKKYSVLAKTFSLISPLPKVHYISPGQLSSPCLMGPESITISIWDGFGGRERQWRTSYRFVNTAAWNDPQHRLSGHIVASPNDIATSKSEVACRPFGHCCLLSNCCSP